MSWNLWALPGTVSMLAALSAAIIVYHTGPDRRLNRRLTLVLALEGMFALGFGPIFFFRAPEVAWAFGLASTAGMILVSLQYLAFLGVALETPLVRPFESRRAFWVLTGLGLAGAATMLALPHHFMTEPYRPGWAPWNWRLQEWGDGVAALHGLVSIFGLVAAVSAYRRTAPGTAARDRAKWFAIAFGVRDAFVGVIQPLFPVLRPVPFWGDFLYNPAQGLVYGTYVILLAYGVLRSQLFDIDLKIKLALRRSTVGAIFAGGFLVFSELIESVVPVHGRAAGVIAALAIVALLRPIEDLARRFTDRVMRGVTMTPDYVDARKIQVYRAALEGALEDGVVSPRETAILERLREQLALSDEDVRAAESGLRAGLSS